MPCFLIFARFFLLRYPAVSIADDACGTLKEWDCSISPSCYWDGDTCVSSCNNFATASDCNSTGRCIYTNESMCILNCTNLKYPGRMCPSLVVAGNCSYQGYDCVRGCSTFPSNETCSKSYCFFGGGRCQQKCNVVTNRTVCKLLDASCLSDYSYSKCQPNCVALGASCNAVEGCFLRGGKCYQDCSLFSRYYCPSDQCRYASPYCRPKCEAYSYLTCPIGKDIHGKDTLCVQNTLAQRCATDCSAISLYYCPSECTKGTACMTPCEEQSPLDCQLPTCMLLNGKCTPNCTAISYSNCPTAKGFCLKTYRSSKELQCDFNCSNLYAQSPSEDTCVSSSCFWKGSMCVQKCSSAPASLCRELEHCSQLGGSECTDRCEQFNDTVTCASLNTCQWRERIKRCAYNCANFSSYCPLGCFAPYPTTQCITDCSLTSNCTGYCQIVAASKCEMTCSIIKRKSFTCPEDCTNPFGKKFCSSLTNCSQRTSATCSSASACWFNGASCERECSTYSQQGDCLSMADCLWQFGKCSSKCHTLNESSCNTFSDCDWSSDKKQCYFVCSKFSSEDDRCPFGCMSRAQYTTCTDDCSFSSATSCTSSSCFVRDSKCIPRCIVVPVSLCTHSHCRLFSKETCIDRCELYTTEDDCNARTCYWTLSQGCVTSPSYVSSTECKGAAYVFMNSVCSMNCSSLSRISCLYQDCTPLSSGCEFRCESFANYTSRASSQCPRGCVYRGSWNCQSDCPVRHNEPSKCDEDPSCLWDPSSAVCRNQCNSYSPTNCPSSFCNYFNDQCNVNCSALSLQECSSSAKIQKACSINQTACSLGCQLRTARTNDCTASYCEVASGIYKCLQKCAEVTSEALCSLQTYCMWIQNKCVDTCNRYSRGSTECEASAMCVSAQSYCVPNCTLMSPSRCNITGGCLLSKNTCLQDCTFFSYSSCPSVGCVKESRKCQIDCQIMDSSDCVGLCTFFNGTCHSACSRFTSSGSCPSTYCFYSGRACLSKCSQFSKTSCSLQSQCFVDESSNTCVASCAAYYSSSYCPSATCHYVQSYVCANDCPNLSAAECAKQNVACHLINGTCSYRCPSYHTSRSYFYNYYLCPRSQCLKGEHGCQYRCSLITSSNPDDCPFPSCLFINGRCQSSCIDMSLSDCENYTSCIIDAGDKCAWKCGALKEKTSCTKIPVCQWKDDGKCRLECSKFSKPCPSDVCFSPIGNTCQDSCTVRTAAECTSPYCTLDNGICLFQCSQIPYTECPPECSRRSFGGHNLCTSNVSDCNFYDEDYVCFAWDHCYWNNGTCVPSCKMYSTSTSCSQQSFCSWQGNRCSVNCRTLPFSSNYCSGLRDCSYYDGKCDYTCSTFHSECPSNCARYGISQNKLGCVQNCSAKSYSGCTSSTCKRNTKNRQCQYSCSSFSHIACPPNCMTQKYSCTEHCYTFDTESVCNNKDGCTWTPGYGCGIKCNLLTSFNCSTQRQCVLKGSACIPLCHAYTSSECAQVSYCRWFSSSARCMYSCGNFLSGSCPVNCADNPADGFFKLCIYKCSSANESSLCSSFGCDWVNGACIKEATQPPAASTARPASSTATPRTTPYPTSVACSKLQRVACEDQSDCSWSTIHQCVDYCPGMLTQQSCKSSSFCEWRAGDCIFACNYYGTEALCAEVPRCEFAGGDCMNNCTQLPFSTCSQTSGCAQLGSGCARDCDTTTKKDTCNGGVCYWNEGAQSCKPNCETTKNAKTLFGACYPGCALRGTECGFDCSAFGDVYSCPRKAGCIFRQSICISGCTASSTCSLTYCTLSGSVCKVRCSSLVTKMDCAASSCYWSVGSTASSCVEPTSKTTTLPLPPAGIPPNSTTPVAVEGYVVLRNSMFSGLTDRKEASLRKALAADIAEAYDVPQSSVKIDLLGATNTQLAVNFSVLSIPAKSARSGSLDIATDTTWTTNTQSLVNTEAGLLGITPQQVAVLETSLYAAADNSNPSDDDDDKKKNIYVYGAVALGVLIVGVVVVVAIVMVNKKKSPNPGTSGHQALKGWEQELVPQGGNPQGGYPQGQGRYPQPNHRPYAGPQGAQEVDLL